MNISLIKKYRQRSFRSKNFNYERPFCFESQAIELTISIHWFLYRSSLLKTVENSTKVPISNTNFSNKVPVSEGYQNM